MMLSVFFLSLGILTGKAEEPPRWAYPYSRAELVVTDRIGPTTSAVANRMVDSVLAGARALVSDDGKAVGAVSGTMDAITVDGRLITANDSFSLLFGPALKLQPTSSSQRGHLPPTNGASVGLAPLALFDAHRVLLASGAPSVYQAGKVDQTFLYVAVVDLKDRLGQANKATKLRIGSHSLPVTLVGEEKNRFVLKTLVTGRERFVSLEPLSMTLQKVSSFAQLRAPDPKERRARLLATFRWGGRWYQLIYGANGVQPVKWEGRNQRLMEPWYMVAQSPNGSYAWIINRETKKSWVITAEAHR
jgi:hypothetical protein